MADFRLPTQRLVLRAWRAQDRVPFGAMNADPAVMEFFPSTLTRPESDALAERFVVEQGERGFCPWVVEERDSGAFVGFVGLHAVPTSLAFSPAVEVGWRLTRPFWGRGYASEAAAASLRFGFDEAGLDEIVSMTAVPNARSRRVMERLGMDRDPKEDFEHPSVPEGPLRVHVLYRLSVDSWRARPDAGGSGGPPA
jgi:RimJ/RimL family protein N-acetyltransferase